MWRAVERWGSQIKSGLNFDFLSRLFGKPKTYTQFESTEDIFTDAKEELESDDENDVILMRDSDPYEVTYERRKTKLKGFGASSDYDVQIHACSSGENKHGLTGQCTSDINSDCQVTETATVLNKSSGHHRQGSSVRDEVSGLVTSVFQRQYNKLENEGSEDDEHVSCDIVCDSDKQQDSKSNVFHSIKDVDPSWKEKKPKRRKKVAKRTRRMIRGTWKWLKRGMTEYARTFNAPSFFVITVSGSALNKSR